MTRTSLREERQIPEPQGPALALFTGNNQPYCSSAAPACPSRSSFPCLLPLTSFLLPLPSTGSHSQPWSGPPPPHLPCPARLPPLISRLPPHFGAPKAQASTSPWESPAPGRASPLPPPSSLRHTVDTLDSGVWAEEEGPRPQGRHQKRRGRTHPRQYITEPGALRSSREQEKACVKINCLLQKCQRPRKAGKWRGNRPEHAGKSPDGTMRHEENSFSD